MENNAERIKKGQGWVPIGKIVDGTQIVEMLREAVNIWHPHKDRILRVINVENVEKNNSTQEQ